MCQCFFYIYVPPVTAPPLQANPVKYWKRIWTNIVPKERALTVSFSSWQLLRHNLAKQSLCCADQ